MRSTSFVLLLGLTVSLGGSSTLGCTTTETRVAVTAAPAAALPGQLPAECAAGQMPFLESNTCEPVGPVACAEGFEVSESGWGCSPILPAEACTGSTRAVLGQTACAPIDDCDRAFPPKNADAVVRDDASLKAALTSVRDGATIALDSGTYSGIEVPLDFRDLHLVGRCADKVKIKGGGERGIFVTSIVKVSVESLTIEGFQAGLVSSWEAKITASHVVLRDTQLPLTAGGDGASLTVTDSVIELTKPQPANAPCVSLQAQQTGVLTVDGVDVRGYPAFAAAYEVGTTVTARRSVFSYTGSADAASEQKILALAGSDITFQESALRFRSGKLAYVARDLPGIAATTKSPGANVHFKDSTVVHSGVELDGPLATAHDGARVSLEGTTLEHQALSAWMIGNAKSAITTKDSVIRGLVKTNTMRNALWMLRGGSADLDNTAIVNSQQNALIATSPGSRLTMNRSLVHETFAGRSKTDPELGAVGVGVLAGAGATVSMKDSAIVRSRHHGVLAIAGAQVEINHSIIDATQTNPDGVGGAGVGAFEARVVMDESLVRASRDVALVFVGGEGMVKRTRFLANPVGVHLSETKIIEATEDPRSSAKNELIFFQNVFEGTETPVREAPYEAPTDPAPLGE